MAVAVAISIVVVFWGGVLMAVLTARGSSPLEFLFGRYQSLPEDLGVWKEGGTSSGGLVREERLLLPEDRANAGYLVQQVRYRDAVTRDIVSVEPERRVRRQRVSARS